MKRNMIRIVCNPYTDKISYFFRNELGEWMILSGSSPLSRQYYAKTAIKDRYIEIIKKLDEIYNRKNKGLVKYKVDMLIAQFSIGADAKKLKEYLEDAVN